MSETKAVKVHVVHGPAVGIYEGLIFVGAFAVKAHADKARQHANATHNRIPGTIGSFRVTTLTVR